MATDIPPGRRRRAGAENPDDMRTPATDDSAAKPDMARVQDDPAASANSAGIVNLPRHSQGSSSAELLKDAVGAPLGDLLSGPDLEAHMVGQALNPAVGLPPDQPATKLNMVKRIPKMQAQTLRALVEKRMSGSCADFLMNEMFPNAMERIDKAVRNRHFDDGSDFPDPVDHFLPGIEFIDRKIKGTSLDTPPIRNALIRRLVRLANAADLDAIEQPDAREAAMIDFGRRALMSYVRRHGLDAPLDETGNPRPQDRRPKFSQSDLDAVRAAGRVDSARVAATAGQPQSEAPQRHVVHLAANPGADQVAQTGSESDEPVGERPAAAPTGRRTVTINEGGTRSTVEIDADGRLFIEGQQPAAGQTSVDVFEGGEHRREIFGEPVESEPATEPAPVAPASQDLPIRDDGPSDETAPVPPYDPSTHPDIANLTGRERVLAELRLDGIAIRLFVDSLTGLSTTGGPPNFKGNEPKVAAAIAIFTQRLASEPGLSFRDTFGEELGIVVRHLSASREHILREMGETEFTVQIMKLLGAVERAFPSGKVESILPGEAFQPLSVQALASIAAINKANALLAALVPPQPSLTAEEERIVRAGWGAAEGLMSSEESDIQILFNTAIANRERD